jgi:hypothetical protein
VDEELPHYLPDFASGPSPVTPAADDAPEPTVARAAAEPARPSEARPSEAYAAPVYESAPIASLAAQTTTDSFGVSTEGLRPSNAALSVVRGLEGQAIRVTRKGKRGPFAFIGKRLTTKQAGTPYKARAYIRTKSPGMYLCLRVHERGAGVSLTTERCAPARAGWRRVALKAKAVGKGNKLLVSIHVMAALGGTSFDVDGFGITGS